MINKKNKGRKFWEIKQQLESKYEPDFLCKFLVGISQLILICMEKICLFTWSRPKPIAILQSFYRKIKIRIYYGQIMLHQSMWFGGDWWTFSVAPVKFMDNFLKPFMLTKNHNLQELRSWHLGQFLNKRED